TFLRLYRSSWGIYGPRSRAGQICRELVCREPASNAATCGNYVYSGVEPRTLPSCQAAHWRKRHMPAREKPSEPSKALLGLAEAPYYHGHRQRLRERFMAAGGGAVSDYELLELVLFRAIPQRDVKPLAKQLLEIFGSFGEVIAAPPARLAEVKGLGDAAITEFKIAATAAPRVSRGEVKRRPVLSSWSSVIDYCRAAMAFGEREEFRILFLDKRNQLITDEVQQTGTVDHTPVYPREVVKRALEL